MTLAKQSLAEARAHCTWSPKPLSAIESTAVAVWRLAESGFGWPAAESMCRGAALHANRIGDLYAASAFVFLAMIANRRAA